MGVRGANLALAWAIGASTTALLAMPAPALAQHIEENAATQSNDAFGRTVGNERSGLYNAEDVRGFNPGEAGNNRLNGLYFDYSGNLPVRLVEGNTVRVGLAAQRYPFPAPSGLVDFDLIMPRGDAELTVVLDTSGAIARGPGGEMDFRLPLAGERLGIAAAFGMREAQRPEGGEHKFRSWAGVAAFRPAEGIELVAFSSAQITRSIEARTSYFPAASAPPPRLERGRFLGLDWTGADADSHVHGAIAKIALGGDWRIHAGLFRATRDQKESFADLLLGVTADGQANRVVIADFGNSDAIWSGEFRVVREWQRGAFSHSLTGSLRGRSRHRLFGGGVRLALGSGPIARPEFWPARAPAIVPGPKNTDDVHQISGGISYSVLWQGRASLDFGITKGTYRKTIDFADPAVIDPVTRDQPLLWNVAASISLSPRLIAYAGISRGQEDAVIAPDIAVNRSEAPPAIRTRQVEAGLRFAITDQLALVVGAFQISRPYLNLDAGLRYRELGRLTSRGIEVSLTGKLAPGLSLVGGLLLSDPRIAGEAVALSQVGERPVGQVRRRLVVSFDWRSQGGNGPLSFDLFVDSQSSRTGNIANTLVAPPRTAVNLGMRYRFALAGTQFTLRPQVQNLFNSYGWQVSPSGGFNYTPDRNFLLSLTADW